MAKKINTTVSAADFIPPSDKPTLTELAAAAASCRGCDLYKRGTQTVFGAGSANSEMVFVGEQPGDYEDRLAQPFVGPAGRILDRRWKKPALTANAYTSLTPSNTSNGSARQTPHSFKTHCAQSPAGRGWRLNWPPSSRTSLYA